MLLLTTTTFEAAGLGPLPLKKLTVAPGLKLAPVMVAVIVLPTWIELGSMLTIDTTAGVGVVVGVLVGKGVFVGVDVLVAVGVGVGGESGVFVGVGVVVDVPVGVGVAVAVAVGVGVAVAGEVEPGSPNSMSSM